MGDKVLVDGRLIDVAEEVERRLREGARPRTLGDYRHTHRALRIVCTRCWYERTVPFTEIPTSRDRWPLSWLKFPHKSCPATGRAYIRVTPV